MPHFYRLPAYLVLFNLLQDQELASDIKQLLLDGRNTAVAMAMALSPLLLPGNLSVLYLLLLFFHQLLSLFVSLSSSSFVFALCVVII